MTSSRRNRSFGPAFFAIFLLVGLGSETMATNVVLIMVDDLGYHDLGCYGHPSIKTPVIDGLAKQGVRLTSFYAGATVCTPSRMALLTGAYPARLGWQKGVVGHIMPALTGLNPSALTIAEVFKQPDYATAMIGKWHLGDEEPFLPHRQGFDVAYYINKSNNQTDELYRNGKLLEKPFDNRRLTEHFTNEAIRFVEANKEKPFFLYLPYTAPHFPVEPHPDWKDKSEYGVYGDVVQEMDARVGELLATIRKLELEKDTIVVFLSDNGPEPLTKESKATPYRGKKWSALEGGTRVPCIVRWPGHVPAGSECDRLIAAIDLLPTLCNACGIDLSKITNKPTAIDGVNVLDTLTQSDGGKRYPRTDLLYWHGADGFQAIRVGDWKLFPNGKDAGLKHRGRNPGPALFHLSKDASESKNVADEFPGRVKAMNELAGRRLQELERNSLGLGSIQARSASE